MNVKKAEPNLEQAVAAERDRCAKLIGELRKEWAKRTQNYPLPGSVPLLIDSVLEVAECRIRNGAG